MSGYFPEPKAKYPINFTQPRKRFEICIKSTP